VSMACRLCEAPPQANCFATILSTVLVAAGALTLYLASGRRACREAVEDLEARAAAAAAPRQQP